MNRLFVVTVRTEHGSRPLYRLYAHNHTEAGAKALAITKRRGYDARLLCVAESE